MFSDNCKNIVFEMFVPPTPDSCGAPEIVGDSESFLGLGNLAAAFHSGPGEPNWIKALKNFDREDFTLSSSNGKYIFCTDVPDWEASVEGDGGGCWHSSTSLAPQRSLSTQRRISTWTLSTWRTRHRPRNLGASKTLTIPSTLASSAHPRGAIFCLPAFPAAPTGDSPTGARSTTELHHLVICDRQRSCAAPMTRRR